MHYLNHVKGKCAWETKWANTHITYHTNLTYWRREIKRSCCYSFQQSRKIECGMVAYIVRDCLPIWHSKYCIDPTPTCSAIKVSSNFVQKCFLSRVWCLCNRQYSSLYYVAYPQVVRCSLLKNEERWKAVEGEGVGECIFLWIVEGITCWDFKPSDVGSPVSKIIIGEGTKTYEKNRCIFNMVPLACVRFLQCIRDTL